MASKYRKVEKEFQELFIDAIQLSNAAYGYISHSECVQRQHTVGGIEDRIPGVFWCNYFSDVYIDFFGKDKFESDLWYEKEYLPNGMIVYLTDKPDKRLLEDASIEENAKKYLGYDSFANKQEEEERKKDSIRWMNEDSIQYKNVPKLI